METARTGSTSERVFRLFVERPIALMLVLATLLVVGALAYARIPIQMFPSGITEPELGVWIPNPGASAKENEQKVARVVEEQLRTLSGIERVRSYSSDNLVRLRIEFSADMDMDLAKAEVRDRLERARVLLPTTVEQIEMWSEDTDQFPILWFGILHQVDSDRNDYLIDRVVEPRLLAVDGVSRVEIWGILDDSVRILLDEERVIAANLDLGSVIRRLSQDNFAQPLGEIDDGGKRVLLRSDMRFGSLEEIADYPVGPPGTGKRLSDLGEVRMVKSVRDRLARINGSLSYFAMITKDSQANVVDVSRRAKAAIEALNVDPLVRDNLQFEVFGTQGEIIESSLDQLRGTALSGGLLAIAVMFVFLRRMRLTLAVALTIPMSGLLAVAWEYFGGGSFNLLTMMGLTLAIGMLIDTPIVVVENATRLRALGLPPREAAVRGTTEIALAISLSTLAAIVVFLPMIFMTEHPILRAMFQALGVPLCTSQLIGLVLALVFLPVVTARALGPRPRWYEALGRWFAPIAALPSRAVALAVAGLRAVSLALVRAVAACNRAVLALLAPLRWLVALGALALAALAWQRTRDGLALAASALSAGPGGASSTLATVAFGALGAVAAALAIFGLPRWRAASRRPAPPRERAPIPALPLLDLLAAGNARLVAWTIQHRLAASGLAALAFLSVIVPATRMTFTPFGQDSDTDYVWFNVSFEDDFTLAEASDEVARYEEFVEARKADWGFADQSAFFDRAGAQISMYWDERQLPSRLDEIKRQLREDLPRWPGHELRFWTRDEGGERDRAQLAFALRGPDSSELERIGERALAVLESMDGLTDVTSPLTTAPDEVRVSFDRDLALDLGVQPDIAQETISWALRGFQLPRYHDEDRELPFLIEYDEEELPGLSTLRDLSVWSGQAPVALSAFADVRFARGSRAIHRENGQTTFALQARVLDPARAVELSREALARLRALEMPRGYSLELGEGATRRQEEEFKELAGAFWLSLALVFLLMGVLFESVLLPLSVLFTVPFGVVGAMWTLYVTGTAMDSIGWIGVIILGGVVVNNGIVLIDCVHRLRHEGMARAAAVVEGCRQRLRPVLMTAVTTVVGLIPTILQEPQSNSIDYRALAACVAGGLAVSTFFTLWVVPLAYTLIDDLSHAVGARVKAAWTRRSPRISAPAPPTPATEA